MLVQQHQQHKNPGQKLWDYETFKNPQIKSLRGESRGGDWFIETSDRLKAHSERHFAMVVNGGVVIRTFEKWNYEKDIMYA